MFGGYMLNDVISNLKHKQSATTSMSFAAKKRHHGSAATAEPTLFEEREEVREKETSTASCRQRPLLAVLLIGAVTLFLLVYGSAHHWLSHDTLPDTQYTQETDLDPQLVQEYDALLRRAADLIEQYKRVTQANANNNNYKNNDNGNKMPESLQSLAGILERTNKQKLSVPVTVAGFERREEWRGSKRDLVLGMAQDTDPKNLAVFCKSLREVSEAVVVIFVNTPVSDRTKEIAKQTNVKLIEFDVESLPEKMRRYHPSTTRWKLYHNYLTKNPKHRILYNRVWMIDVRDSFFQADPFLILSPQQSSLSVFTGQEAVSIAQCSWNGGWVRDCFGESMVRQIGRDKIICSGVVAGTIDRVIEYVHTMSEIVQGKPLPVLKDEEEMEDEEEPTVQGSSLNARRKSVSHRFPQCERNGVDQGVHNVLVHAHLLSPSLTVYDQRSGPVANLQAQIARFDEAEKRVFNGKREPSIVVHQYDRVPSLQRFLFGKYIDWTNANDFDNEWASEPSCKDFSYKKDEDLFKGRCDLESKGGATSAASCCVFCTKTENCQAFTFVGSACFLKSCSNFRPGFSSPLAEAVSAYKSPS